VHGFEYSAWNAIPSSAGLPDTRKHRWRCGQVLLDYQLVTIWHMPIEHFGMPLELCTTIYNMRHAL